MGPDWGCSDPGGILVEDALGRLGSTLGRPAPEDELEHDGDQRADDRANEIDPVMVEVAADERRGQLTTRVH